MTSRIFGNEDSTLNGDIITHMMERLPDSQLINFAQTNRAIYELSKPLLLRRKYRQTASFEANHNKPLELPKILQAAPKVARYIRDIVCNGEAIQNGVNNTATAYSTMPEEADVVRYFIAWMVRLGYLSETCGAAVEREIVHGRVLKEALIVLSIVLCSRVQTLVFKGSVAAFGQPLFVFFIKHIDVATVSRRIPTNDLIKTPFNRLRELEFYSARSSSNMESFSCLQLLVFTHIPSLLVLKVSKVKVEGTGLSPGQDINNFPLSGTRKVVFSNCQIADPNDMAFFARMLPKLTFIAYHDTYNFTGQAGGFLAGGMGGQGLENQGMTRYIEHFEVARVLQLRRPLMSKPSRDERAAPEGHPRVRWWFLLEIQGGAVDNYYD